MINNQVREKKRLLVGLDLGQQNDYTVLSYMFVTRPKEALHNKGLKRRNSYIIKAVSVVPLNTPYPNIVSWIVNLANTNFSKYNYTIVVDYTGVGRPIVDMIRQQDIKVVAVNTTGGHKTTWKTSYEVNVPKKDIVTSLKASLEDNRAKFAEGLPNYHDDIVKEFINFQEKISNSINLQYEGKHGYHDDIVMSIGLAIWYGENRITPKKKIRILTWN